MQTGKDFPFWGGLDVSEDSFEAAGGSIVRSEGIHRPGQGGFAIDAKDVAHFVKWAREVAGAFKFGIGIEATGGGFPTACRAHPGSRA